MGKHVPATVQTEIGGRLFKFETGKVAKLASGAVMCTFGETVVLATAPRLSRAVPLPPDVSGVRFAAKVVSWGGRPPPFFAVVERRTQTLAPRPVPFHVLWVVHETVGAPYLRPPDGTPVARHHLALQGDPAAAQGARNIMWRGKQGVACPRTAFGRLRHITSVDT